jgi:hypothetical protein
MLSRRPEARREESRAGFGLKLLQSGDDRAAFDLWIEIIRDTPADAEWLSGLRAQARGLATKLNIDPKKSGTVDYEYANGANDGPFDSPIARIQTTA